MTKNSYSSLLKKQRKMYLNHLKEESNSYSNLIKNQKLLLNQFRSNWINQQRQELKDFCDEITDIADSIAKVGWPLAPELDYRDVKTWLDAGLHDNQLNEKLVEYYTKNNFQKLYKEFDNIERLMAQDTSSQGYLKQVEKVRSTFQKDNTSFLITINCIVSIIDYEFINALGRLDSNEITRHGKVADLEREDEQEEYRNFMAISSEKALMSFLVFSNFSDGIDQTKFTRHSIQHGRYNPSRLTEGDLVKCVCLLSSVCYLNKIKKEEN